MYTINVQDAVWYEWKVNSWIRVVVFCIYHFYSSSIPLFWSRLHLPSFPSLKWLSKGISKGGSKGLSTHVHLKIIVQSITGHRSLPSGIVPFDPRRSCHTLFSYCRMIIIALREETQSLWQKYEVVSKQLCGYRASWNTFLAQMCYGSHKFAHFKKALWMP